MISTGDPPFTCFCYNIKTGTLLEAEHLFGHPGQHDNDNDLFIILTGIHSKYTFFDMLHSRYYLAPQDLSVSLNTIQ